jgi:murein DD-endopeptidase MepM/ murein hydrolase activator NlpD
MKGKTIKIAVIAGLFCALIGAPAAFGEYQDFDQEIDALNQRIREQREQIEGIKARQQEYQAAIAAKQRDKATLNNQLAIIENRLAKAELDIDSASLEIDKASLEIEKIKIDGRLLDKKIESQKEHIAALLRLVYKQDQVSTLEMLLANDSLSDFLNQARYLEDTNKEIGDSVADLQDDKEELENNEKSLSQKIGELEGMKKSLEQKREILAYEQDNKSYVLEETKSSEREYQALLAQARREQKQAEAEISSAETLIRQKLSAKERERLNNGNNSIAWPVPQTMITARFHDPDYPYANVIGAHPAIDIRAAQGTTIKAAADGYVAKVKFDGTRSYAYIMIIHGNGLSTVYGHVSAVYVKTDEYVVQGQAIGRTGGTPGTPGSGPWTTGPHLHFEVRSNGLPVNPESYLP